MNDFCRQPCSRQYGGYLGGLQDRNYQRRGHPNRAGKGGELYVVIFIRVAYNQKVSLKNTIVYLFTNSALETALN